FCSAISLLSPCCTESQRSRRALRGLGAFAGQFFSNLSLHSRLIDLADTGYRKLVDHFDSFGALELCQALRDEKGGQLTHGRRLLAGVRYDEHTAFLAVDGVGHGDQ